MRKILVIVGLVGFACVSLAPASADEYFVPTPPAPGFIADSSDHWYCFHSSVASADRQRFHDAMAYLDSATDMYDSYTSTCGSSTDVAFFFATPIPNEPAGTRGVVYCFSELGYGVCDVFWVFIDPIEIAVQANWDVLNFEFNLHKTIRHEIGHTTGLRHSNGGGSALSPLSRYQTMISGPIANDFAFLSYESTDHIPHVNGVF